MRSKNYQLISAFVIFCLLAVSFLLFEPVLAQTDGTGSGSSIYGNIQKAVEGTPASQQTNALSIVGGIVNVLLSMVGVALVLTIIYAGILWGFLSNGDSAKINKAKQIITNAVIGLLLVFASYAIASFVIDQYFQIQASPGGSAPQLEGSNPTD